MDRNILPQIIFNSIRFSAVRPEVINMLISKLEEYQLSNYLSTGTIQSVVELLFTHTETNNTNIYYGEEWLTYLMELDSEINSIGAGEQFELLYENYCNHYLDIVGTRSAILKDDSLIDELNIQERASLKYVKLVWFIVSNIAPFKECINGILYNGGNMNLSTYDENQPTESMEGDLADNDIY